MTKIKFGTDGWRAIIAKEFTVDNVARVAQGTAIWLKKNFDKPSVVIGHDCRFGGELFAETCAKVLASNGVKVLLAKGFVSTPMISLGANELKASVGIILTASHNPASYNGFKLKGNYGGPLLVESVQEIEDAIPETHGLDLDKIKLSSFEKEGLLEYVDLEEMYYQKVIANFDLDAIKKSGITLGYDAMYGAGQKVMKRILPDAKFFRCSEDPSFGGVAPEPIMKNLHGFHKFINDDGNIAMGLITDGDADRLGLMDDKGNFIDSHHIMLLLIHYFVKYKGLKGKICTAASSTVKIKTLCDAYGLELEVVQIGFKWICAIMVADKNVMLGGEESGGIALKGHIPERDGIWVGLTMLEFMAKTGKTINELIEEVYAVVGTFAFERSDLHLDQELKDLIVKKCENNEFKKIGNREITEISRIDGFKYFFSDSEWLMIRPSGTEPVLRTYAESSSQTSAKAILDDCYASIMEANKVFA